MRKGKVFSYIRTQAVRTKAGTYIRSGQSAQNTLDLTQDETVRTSTALATIRRNTILQLSPLKSNLFVTIVNNRDITPLTAQNGRTGTDIRLRSNRLSKPGLRLVASESLAIRRRALV